MTFLRFVENNTTGAILEVKIGVFARTRLSFISDSIGIGPILKEFINNYNKLKWRIPKIKL